MRSLTSCMRATERKRGQMFATGFFRATALSIAVFSVAACAGNPVQAPTVVLEDTSFATQAALRNILLSRKSASPSQANQLLAFYQSRNFQPAWTADAQADAGAVRAGLARAHEQGLRDDDYKLSRNASPTTAEEVAQYDVALTDAVLRYSRDVRTGRVQPNAVYEDIELPASGFDAAAALTKALANHGIAKFLADLPPSHPEYRRLAEALTQYRAIADAGGWPSLPGS